MAGVFLYMDSSISRYGPAPVYSVQLQFSDTDRGFIIIIIGKAIPLQAWTGPEGSRRLRLPDFKTIGI